MRILFFQPNHTGHHFAYLGRMLPGFVDLPVELVLATPSAALKTPEYEATLAPYEDSFRVDPIEAPGPPEPRLANARWRYAQLLAAIKRTNPDHVCLLYADGLWQLIALATLVGRRGLPPGPSYEAWLYRGGFAYPDARRVTNRLRRWLFGRLLKRGLINRIHIDDELAHAFATDIDEARTDSVLAVNPIVLHPPQSRADARHRMGIEAPGPVISLSGVIARYKGAHLIVDAMRFLKVESGGPQPTLVLAGPHQEDLRQLLRRTEYSELIETGRLLSIDRFLSEEEMFAVAAASDLVVAPYFKHSGRSSIILWAAAAGRPVVAVDRGCIRHVVEAESLGTTCDVTDPRVFAAEIQKSLASPWGEADEQRVRDYASWHSIENYQRLCSEFIRKQLESSR